MYRQKWAQVWLRFLWRQTARAVWKFCPVFSDTSFSNIYRYFWTVREWLCIQKLFGVNRLAKTKLHVVQINSPHLISRGMHTNGFRLVETRIGSMKHLKGTCYVPTPLKQYCVSNHCSFKWAYHTVLHPSFYFSVYIAYLWSLWWNSGVFQKFLVNWSETNWQIAVSKGSKICLSLSKISAFSDSRIDLIFELNICWGYFNWTIQRCLQKLYLRNM